MTAFAILRLAKLKSLGNAGGSLLHTYRARDTPNADPALTPSNEHSHSSHSEAMASLRARIPTKHRSDAVLAIEYFVGSSPQWFKDKTPEQHRAYFADALDWLRQQHGAQNVVAWSIHRDESSPHLVAYVVPIDPDTGRLNAKKWTGGKAVLSKMQTDFAHKVGLAHEMHRGIEGSKARHQTIQKFYGQLEKYPEHVKITPEIIKPKVIKKGIFTTEYEDQETISERLTKAVQRVYEPAVENAKVAKSAQQRSREMERTALAKEAELKQAQERYNDMARALQPFIQLGQLDREEYMLLLKSVNEQVKQLRKKRDFISARQYRVDQLAKLEQKSAGASLTLATHALAALDRVNGDPAKVNWDQVELAAAREAIQLYHQSRESVLKAIIDHSPGMADQNRLQAVSTTIRAIPEPHPDHSIQQAPKNKGPRLGR